MSQQHLINQKHNYYDLLGINQEASSSDIKRAYYNLAVQYHPDKNLHNKEESAKNFQKINQAYKVLSNDEQRNLYNFLGSEDYHVYKNQNSNFQNLFNSAFKMKSCFEQNRPSFMDQAAEILLGGGSSSKKVPNNMQKAFQDFFEEESSSEEEEEDQKSSNVYSFSNRFTMSCDIQMNQNNNYYYQQNHFQAQFSDKYGNTFEGNRFSANFTHSQTRFKTPPDQPKLKKKDQDQQIREMIRRKKPMFSVLHNQIRKKRKNQGC